MVTISATIVIIILAVGLCSNPPKSKTVEDYAWEYIDMQIEMYEDIEWGVENYRQR